jgi:hypothetical protein
MMSRAAALLSTLRARGVQFVVAGSHLCFRPIEQVSPAERAALLKYKNGLVMLICELDQLERDGTASQLRAIAATLTAAEQRRLAAEAAAGDRLAQLVAAVLASGATREATAPPRSPAAPRAGGGNGAGWTAGATGPSGPAGAARQDLYAVATQMPEERP